MNQLLTEIDLTSINSTNIYTSKIKINKPTIFMLIPDININITEAIKNSNLLLNNCGGIISPSTAITVFGRKLNRKEYVVSLRKNIKDIGKNIPILENIPPNIDGKTFYFYDMSQYIVLLNQLGSVFSEKQIAGILLTELTQSYNILKRQNNVLFCELLFNVNNKDNILCQLLINIKQLISAQKLSEMIFFDNYGLVSVNEHIVSLFDKNKLKTRLVSANISKILTLVQTNDTKENDDVIVGKMPMDAINTRKESTLVSMAKQKITDSNIDVDKNFKVSIDTKKLTDVLMKYKITDPDIIANVKVSIETYSEQHKTKVTREELESVVLKAINYTIHGKEELDIEYVNDPRKLIRKLSEIRTHKTPLEFPNKLSIINPKDIVTIQDTTGVWRQKQEFEKTIHQNVEKLFKSLEHMGNRPIKILDMHHEITDDDLNRFINYKITLKNTDGGDNQPYVVELQVPGLINDRSFKIRGSNYIMATQQFLKPLTKTDKKEIRLLSNYAIVRVGVKNLKFTPSDINDILNYIKVRYPILIKELTNDKCVFNDNSIIHLSGTDVYESKDTKIVIDPNNGYLINDDGNEIKLKKYEYLFDKILEKIAVINPEDKLTKTKKTIPYIYLYMGGITLPLIVYLWLLKGLLITLNDLGINYTITDKITKGDIFIKHTDGNYLVIMPETLRQKLIINGLLAARIKGPFSDFNDPEEIHPFIDSTYGSGALYNLKILTQNEIDPVTRELLQFENLPTDLPKLLSNNCIDMLLNDKTKSLSDLNIYRARLSEMIIASMYEVLTQAHNHYIRKVDYGDQKAKLGIDSQYIIKDLITKVGVLEITEPVTPVDEIFLASRTIKSGKGGVPSKAMFKIEHRNIHPSQYGIMSANSTPESQNVGLIVSHTLTPIIVNEYGSYGVKDINAMTGWGALAATECLTPFQNQVDSGRMVLAATHAKQVTPTNGCEAPLVSTGGEFIIPQISSSRFVHIAKHDGKIIEIVPNKTITVEYNNGKTHVFDILPRLSRTKMGMYMLLEMNTHNDVGDTIKRNEVIAGTKNFDKNGRYCSGRNLFIAVMQYNGFGHEDSYVITEDVANKMTRSIVKELQIIIPPTTKIIQFEKEVGKQITENDILVEFSYKDDLQQYIDLNQIDQVDDDDVINMYVQGNETIKLPGQEGEIVDIKIYVNNKANMDKKILNHHKQLVSDTQEVIHKLASTAQTQDEKYKAIDNINLKFISIGGHKLKGGHEFTGARIVYYIKQNLPLSDGDKLANRYGAKGVIGKIIDKNNIPRSEFVPNIDIFISPIGVFSRKNIALIKEIYIGKIIYFSNIKLLEMVEQKKSERDIKNFIYTIYDIFGLDEVTNSVKKSIDRFGDNQLYKEINNGNLKLFMTIPPFRNIEFKNIRKAAEFINVPLDEKVYIPELKCWTKNKVPVGVSYMQALEQTSEVYSNVRSLGKYASLTGQATKGKSREGGQAIGYLDIYGLLTYNVPALLNELLTLRSDDHKSKRQIVNEIYTTGEANLPQKMGKGDTGNLMRTFMTGLGLHFV